MMDTTRLQELVDFALVTLLDIQGILSREYLGVDPGEIFELFGVVDEYPTEADEEWLHNELVNNDNL